MRSAEAAATTGAMPAVVRMAEPTLNSSDLASENTSSPSLPIATLESSLTGPSVTHVMLAVEGSVKKSP